jgi:hypothetical protein
MTMTMTRHATQYTYHEVSTTTTTGTYNIEARIVIAVLV